MSVAAQGYCADSPENIARRVDELLAAEVLAGKSVSPAADDQTFLRRLSFDLIGDLPTPEEVTAFVLDPSTDKRRPAVETLLADPHFGQNWARYWRDAILARRTDERALRLSANSVTVYLTEQYNQGAGWDQIARAFITAEGDVQRRGDTAVIMAQEGKASETAAEMSRLLLGIQIQCAQCHDHPYDDWTREQFHQLAAFFPRTSVRPKRNAVIRTFEVVAGDARLPRFAGRQQNFSLEHYMPDLENPQQRGTLMQPVLFVSGQSLEIGASDQQRRATLADWITAPQNPWFAKAYVNRIWSELVGRGFYEPVDDLGENRDCLAPQTLDYLAGQFVAHAYDVKWLFRVITATDAYQRPSRSRGGPADAPLAANCPQPLRADQLLNALTSALGVAEPPPRSGPDRPRLRLNNVRAQFNLAFGYDPSVSRDEVAASISQALMLMNSPHIERAIKATAQGNLLPASRPSVADDELKITEIYLRCLAREPTDNELATCRDHIETSPNRRQAYEDLLWALVNSTEFRLRN